MIELRNISKAFSAAGEPVRAVRGVSLTLQRGDFAAVTGRSGSGKSTLLGIIGSLLRPDAGTILVAGRDVWAMEDSGRARLRRDTFGFIYQFPSLLPTLTAAENVLLSTVFGGHAGPEDAERLLDMVGLGGKGRRHPAELSGGEQQRVSVARALANDPLVLLADEPTGDLDEDAEQDILRLFERLAADRGLTVIMATHDGAIAARAPRRFIMHAGATEEST